MKLPNGFAIGAPAVIIGILVIGYLVKTCQGPDNPPKLPPALVKTIDSLDNTKPEFEAKQDSLIHKVVYDTVKATIYAAAATRAKSAAATAERRADSLAAEARSATDSTRAWREAYDARTTEAVGLRLAVAKTDSAYQFERSARLSLSEAYGADTLRRVALERLNVGLRKTIDELERPCKVLRFLSCPSRTTTAVVSAIVGAGAVYVTKNP